MHVWAVCVAVLVGWAGTAQAEDCVTAQDLAQGIDVTTASGAVYHYTSNGKRVMGTMVVQDDDLTIRMDLTFMGGIYLTEQVKTFGQTRPAGSEDVVGGMDGEVVTDRFRYAAMPALASGQGYAAEVAYIGDANGPEIGPQPTQSTKLEARLTALPEQSATWGGCTYRVRPVETEIVMTQATQWIIGGADLQQGPADQVGQPFYTRRLLYFPDLGFAVVTRMGPGRGEVGMKLTNGLKGLARSGG